MKPQVPYHYYSNASYNSKERFISYWHQIQEINSLEVKDVLEIGIGNGFVSDYLKKQGINVTTLDFDRDLKPDVAGSVTAIPFADHSFAAIYCCEVLEHLPFENFSAALAEIHRVARNYAVLSMPDSSWFFSLNLKFPGLPKIKLLWSFPRLWRRVHRFNGHHYWEIGKAGYSLPVIAAEINRAGFAIPRTYRIPELPDHRFFVLKKAAAKAH